MVSLMISLFIFMNIKDITNIETLPLVSMGFIFIGVAGGTIIAKLYQLKGEEL